MELPHPFAALSTQDITGRCTVEDWKGWTGSVTIDPGNGNRQPATVVIVETDAEGHLRVDEDWAKAVGAPY